jgi:hypothetical protein
MCGSGGSGGWEAVEFGSRVVAVVDGSPPARSGVQALL